MTDDKWGIPHIYKTADNAGITGSGSGFIWYQNNDIRKDSQNCIVRIGKELDSINVISTVTGEWEFPYDSGAEAYTLETETGHHSGNESHGCEGSEYMGEVTINTTPPKFRFKKQMYHGGSKFSRGDFTHPKVTQKIIGNGWRGLCIVRYNVKDGRSAGHDAVKLEMYFNQDPDNHLKDGWIKVGETLDKGGWGKGGDTCGGVSDQVLTWSNVQFRYKSGTPEWSVHPIIPECENGENVHSIDGANNDFAEDENRGYAKKSNMPRDIEMKILFKFASTDGKARLKNASLREITPTEAPTDNPQTPDPTDQPGETQTLEGKFQLKWDLNTERESPCAASGVTDFFNTVVIDEDTSELIIDEDRNMSNSVDDEYRDRIAQKCLNSSSIMKGKKPVLFQVPLRGRGSVLSSPTIGAKIWSATNSVVYTSPTTIDPTTLSTSDFALISFDFSTNTHALAVGDYIGIVYTGTDTDNNIEVAVTSGDSIPNSCRSNYNDNTDTWTDVTTSDLACIMWEA